MQQSNELTGQQIVDQMPPEARAEAQEEFNHVAPGPSDPMRMGDEEARTELNEDPISEGGASRQSRP